MAVKWMRGLSYEIRLLETIGEDARSDMFALYNRYYDGTSEELFRRDLAEKQYVIILHDKQDRMQGFSTVAVTEHRFEGKAVRSFFSGDTVVDQLFWGQQTLPAAFLRLSGSVKAEAPEVPLYWFFPVMSQRTYRYLRAFFKVFFPAHDRGTPPRAKALMDLLAGERFGDAYDADRGVISFATSQGHMNPSLAEIPNKVRQKPDVRFFLERNPGYFKGDELVCLAELAPSNLRPLADRLFRKGIDDGIGCNPPSSGPPPGT